jgi:hypothetical protein
VPLNDKASGLTESSEYGWEPGSAMVPTFCVEIDSMPLGRAKLGDLPLAGEGGGEPKRESSSSWSLDALGIPQWACQCSPLQRDDERKKKLVFGTERTRVSEICHSICLCLKASDWLGSWHCLSGKFI